MNIEDRRRGGHARAATLSPAERREAGRRAYFAGAFRTVLKRVQDLSPGQREQLKAALESLESVGH